MISESYKSIITKLIEKTENKKAIWNKTSRNNEYKLNLEQGAITTDRWNDSDLGGELIDFSIWNEDGNTIDTLQVSAYDNDDFKLLTQLHNAARRAYYKVDETLKNLNNLLNSDGILGKQPENDDLPF